MTPDKPNFASQCLDQAVAAAYPRALYATAPGDAFAAIAPWLMVGEYPASSVPCLRSAETLCAYRVVELPDGSHCGVCDNGYCPDRDLTPDDIAQLTADTARLRAALAALLGIEPDTGPPPHPCLLPLGRLSVGTGHSLPVYLAGGPNTEHTEAAVRRLWESTPETTLILTLSRCSGKPPLTAFLRRAGWPHHCLEAALEITPAALRWQPGAESAWHAFAASLAPQTESHVDRAQQRKQAGEAAPKTLPKNLRWSEVTLRFLDGHTVSVAARDYKVRLSFAEMGFEDKRTKRPDVQWRLLETFAADHGRLTWETRGARPQLKKAVQRLAKDLKAFFRIDEPPFVYRKDLKGWEAAFSLSQRQ